MTKSSETLRTLDDLAAAGLIPAGDVEAAGLAQVFEQYAVAITPQMADLIDGDPANDPIARQFVPTTQELVTTADERADPIGDKAHEAVPGVVHRYRDRVLLKVTHACPVYCRFCFRREMVGPGGEQSLSASALDRAVDYIASDPDIFEVILTGGDPFVLSPRRIADLTARLSAIKHVQVLRWHTRVPLVDPARVTQDLIASLKSDGTAVYVALHANHPREFTFQGRAAITRLVAAGIPLVSQTVLLKGVNDDVETLAALMRTFAANRVKPYYLHHADLAPGTGHFRTTVAEGQALMRALRGQLSGLAQPTYVLDIPGGVAKVPIGPSFTDDEAGHVIAPDGTAYAYALRG